MKSIFESVIRNGGYDLTDMLRKIDVYHVEGRLTDGEREELIALARDGAEIEGSVNVMDKLADLDRRVTALESAGEPGTGEAYPAYQAGRWYYAGDQVTFEGRRYVCIAPEGVVCTWSPADYPAYWQEADV